MRIIYGKDYYDNALAYGKDESIVLVREKSRFMSDREVNSGVPWHVREFTYKNMRYKLESIVVFFCGKIYEGIRAEFQPQFGSYEPAQFTFFWHAAEFSAWVDSNGIREPMERQYPYTYKQIDKKMTFSGYFHAWENPTKRDWMIENHVFCAVRMPEPFDKVWATAKPPHGFYDGWEMQYWAVNCDKLKDVQFFKVFDHYAAFQEISMWVGGVLPKPGNPMVEISDIVRVEKHGFDKKTSFRKEKEK